jgi:hypothetical protein
MNDESEVERRLVEIMKQKMLPIRPVLIADSIQM